MRRWPHGRRMTRSCSTGHASSPAASAKPTSTRSRRPPTAMSIRRQSMPRRRRHLEQRTSCATSGRMGDGHGATDLSRGRRPGDHAGDGAGPQCRLPRRGRRRRRRSVQGHCRVARALRTETGARHADLRAGDPRRGDGSGDDRTPAHRRDHVRRLLCGVLGPRRQSDRQELIHDRGSGELPAGDQIGQRRRSALRGPALAIGRELGNGDSGAQGGRAVEPHRCHRPLRRCGSRPRSGDVLRTQGPVFEQGRGCGRRDRRHPWLGEGVAHRRGRDHRRPRGDGATSGCGRRRARPARHRGRRDRCAQSGTPGHADHPARGVGHGTAVYGGGESASLRLGRRARVDRCRGVLQLPRRAAAPHHHAAHPAPISRRARGHGDSVSRAHRHHHREGHGVMTTMLRPEAVGAPTQLMIAGRWVDASDSQTFEVDDPATGEVIATVANASVEDGLAAVSAASDALPGWAASPPRQRAELLRRTFELMTERAEDFARLIVRENGKALPDARGEVAYAAEFFRWYAEEAVRAEGHVQMAPAGTNRILVLRQPIGVSILITPWNFPAAMATRKIGPALAAGCTVVLKPASDTPLTALAMGALLMEAGVPAGVVNVVPSRRSGPVVNAMLHDPRVRKLSFTGSTEVGRALLQQAADCIVNCSMELGGNAPFVVFDDADLESAVAGAMVAKMRNGGEACTAANRFLVQRGIAKDFSRRLTETMSALRVGPGLNEGVQLGPLINAAGRDKVVSLVAGAGRDGARLAVGGEVPEGPGFFYPPTVLVDVPSHAAILREEVFGPVAPVVVFDTEEEAVAMANDTEYGLVAYVYTRDLQRGLRFSAARESGMVGLNRPIVSDPAAPFGGVKQSGLGREGGHDGLLEFMESKYIAVTW